MDIFYESFLWKLNRNVIMQAESNANDIHSFTRNLINAVFNK